MKGLFKNMINNFNYTPYNKEVDEALVRLQENFEYFDFYKDFQIVLNYIEKLENIIYGYTD